MEVWPLIAFLGYESLTSMQAMCMEGPRSLQTERPAYKESISKNRAISSDIIGTNIILLANTHLEKGTADHALSHVVCV